VRALPSPEAHAFDDERRMRLIAQARPELRGELGAELILAADQFIIKPNTRPRDEAVLNAQGDTACTVIAGYPWFTDWGRDTMISLEGLTLTTGRFAEARDILHTFAHHVRDGLIPNLFPEGQNEGLYHTADATLWFFHAIDRYEAVTGDRETRRFLLPKLAEIIEKHIAGTRFGIGVDPADGLLRQGALGYQLTWMDAKVGDWVVTPRRGKAVEINALFYNALRLMERWLGEAENDGVAAERGIALRAAEADRRAAVLQASFNRRFWYAEGGYLYDVVDGEANDGGRPRDDASLRPNQLLAISLPHPVLDPVHWRAVLDVAARGLATPFGLRSLAPGDPDYKARYDGDLRARDAAYHQGTVWGWLVGPFVDAWLKVHPDDSVGAARLLDGLEEQLSKSCIGTISEICDAEPPFSPRGCMAQAWSVAEALRALSLIRALERR
jgi:predicted glycogen debranching enzyme